MVSILLGWKDKFCFLAKQSYFQFSTVFLCISLIAKEYQLFLQWHYALSLLLSYIHFEGFQFYPEAWLSMLQVHFSLQWLHPTLD